MVEVEAWPSGLPLTLASRVATLASAGLLVSDPEGTVLWANPAAARLLRRPQLVGSELGLLPSSGVPTRVEAVSDGSEVRSVELRAIDIEHDGGPALLVTVTEVDLLPAGAIGLPNGTADARALASLFAHELRTPLTAVLGYSDLLAARWRDLPEGRVDAMLGAVLRNARRLVRVSHRLAMQERISSGAVAARPQDLLLGRTLRTVVRDAFGSNDHVRVVGDQEAAVRVDPEHLTDIVDNLVENALEHGRPPVEVAVVIRDDRAGFRVTDRGPGVADSVRDRLFDAWVRHTDRGGEVTGTGLGLYIARHLVETNGGEIGFVPADEGARVEVLLPAVAQPPET